MNDIFVGEVAGAFAVGQFDHHRLKGALVAPVDGGDSAGGGGRVEGAGGLFIFEECLAALDGVAFFDEHGRLHADVIGGDESDAGDRGRGMDCLFRRTRDGQVEAFFNFVERHGMCSTQRFRAGPPQGCRSARKSGISSDPAMD